MTDQTAMMRGRRAWGAAVFLVVLSWLSAQSEAWHAAAGVLGTAVSALLVQSASIGFVAAVPLVALAFLLGTQLPFGQAAVAVIQTILTGAVMGFLVRRGLPPLVAMLGAALTLVLPGLGAFLLEGSRAILRPDARLVDELVTGAMEQYRQLNISEERLSEAAQMLRAFVELVLTVLPALRFLGILAMTFMIYLVCQSLFTRLGLGIRPVGRFTFWRLSHWYVWAFAAALTGILIPMEPYHFVGKNLLVVMIAAYFVQGLSVTQCLMVRRGVGLPFRLLIYFTAVVAILPFFAAMTTGIGLFDTWFDFRGLDPREEPDEEEGSPREGGPE